MYTIDIVRAETPKAAFHRLDYVLSSTTELVRAILPHRAELRADNHLPAESAVKRQTYVLLGQTLGVHAGCVDERHAAIGGSPYDGSGLRRVSPDPKAVRSETGLGNFKTGIAKMPVAQHALPA